MGSRILIHNLGYPRMGESRQLKKAVESYWAGKYGEAELMAVSRDLRRTNWLQQINSGVDLIPSNDFSLYDHVLDTVFMVGAVPDRFLSAGKSGGLDTYFAMARGRAGAEKQSSCTCCNAGEAHAMEMTKWFDTNYHYIVPELHAGQSFELASTKALDEFQEALSIGIKTKPVLLGPVTFLKLGKIKDSKDRWKLLPSLLDVYVELLRRLERAGAEWVQLDEPVVSLDLNEDELSALKTTYGRIAGEVPGIKVIVANYFGRLGSNLETFAQLPVTALHFDVAQSAHELDAIIGAIQPAQSLSLGIVSGRNIWKNDYAESTAIIRKAIEALGVDRLLIAPTCALMHVPVSLRYERNLDPQLLDWLAFADEKLIELANLRTISEGDGELLALNARSMANRRTSKKIHSEEIQSRADLVTESDLKRLSHFNKRRASQQKRLNLPRFPTTTIGSFPQTKEVRGQRALFRKGAITESAYNQFLQTETERVIRLQEEIGLDVLVHGEFERTDMVEYFGEQLDGFAFTENGWVQSYGSRCVKPPILFGDVARPGPMTVGWAEFAQGLTQKPMKGMLTGPITILQWSFVRDDQPRSKTARQIALAIRDEVMDLESAGISVIQVDEPALREGLPLRSEDWPKYLRWAVDAFKLATAGVRDDTQIHTHMCYCEFNDILESIAALDADVISFESSRSKMELLDAFREFKYPNDVGPGIYDIHSPRIPSENEMIDLLDRAKAVLVPDRIWVNPDCGLKTRGWSEVESALLNLVSAARKLRLS
jgi:5-methyltetrahydropteroyltriglutamate--homocysteine methyltransferase